MYKILIIEDNTDIRQNLEEILTLSGYEVTTSADGKEGIQKSIEVQPDLVLCDIVMPKIDGYSTIKILNENPKTAGIPVIFLTAKAEKEDFRKGMSLGAFDYITKPFDDVTLLRTIETRLDKFKLLKNASKPDFGSIDQFLFEARGMEALSHLPDNCETRRYPKNATIFFEDDSAFWLFYIEKGIIKTFKTSEDGKDLITTIHSAGDFVGYLDLLQDIPYTTSAAVIEECIVKLVPKAEFLALVSGNRDVALRFIKMLANHVTEQEKRLLHLAYHSVRKRVAESLLNLADKDDGHVRMFRGDLASVVGAAKETLIRTLSEFNLEGLIDIKGSTITVLNREKLLAMPN